MPNGRDGRLRQRGRRTVGNLRRDGRSLAGIKDTVTFADLLTSGELHAT